jgi:hypothetical protein
MIRKLKSLGLALTAVLALSAIGTTVAQAAVGNLDLGATNSILTASQTSELKLKLTASGVTVKCPTATLEGTTQANEVSTVKLKPNYGGVNGCNIGGVNTTIDANSCEYELVGGVNTKTAVANVVGCGTGAITITNGACEITVKNQGPRNEVTFENGTNEILANVNITGVIYQGDAGCPANQQGQRSDGDLTGQTTVIAKEDNGGAEGSTVSIVAT